MVIPVNFDSTHAITTDDLQAVSSYIYKPLSLLVCMICKTAVPPGSFEAHTTNAHGGGKTRLALARTVLQAHRADIRKENVISEWCDDTPPIPGIPFRRAFRCGSINCQAVRSSLETIKKHFRDCHHSTIIGQSFSALDCYAQSIFQSHATWYAVQRPETVPASDASDFAAIALEKLEAARPNMMVRADTDPAILNPFLSKYKWHLLIEGADTDTIRRLIASPETDSALTNSVTDYYDRIIQSMADPGDRPTTILRKLASTT
jgi:hypothetical protein